MVAVVAVVDHEAVEDAEVPPAVVVADVDSRFSVFYENHPAFVSVFATGLILHHMGYNVLFLFSTTQARGPDMDGG